MDKLVIRKYQRLYFKGDKVYLFDVPAFVKAVEKKEYLSNMDLATKLELVADDEKGKGKMAYRVKRYLQGKEKKIGINTVHLLGLAFGGGNEMAFLEEIKIETIAQALMEYEKDCIVKYK